MRRGGRGQGGGGNFGGRGLLGSVPHGESSFGNVQQSTPGPGLLGPGLQAAGILNSQGGGGIENLLRSSGILGGLSVGGVGSLAGAGLGASLLQQQQELLARQQQAALLTLVQQQQQGLFNAQQGLIGNRPAGLEGGNPRSFGSNQAADGLMGGRGLLGSGSTNFSDGYDDEYKQYDDRHNRDNRMNRMPEGERAARMGRTDRPREIIQINTDRASEARPGVGRGGRGVGRPFVGATGRKEDLRDRLQEKGEKRFRSQESDELGSDNVSFNCHACSANFSSLLEFDRHMNSAMHRERMGTMIELHGMQTEQQMSRMKAQEHLRKIEQRRDDHCKICERPMYGDPREHYADAEHKRKEMRTRFGCAMCKTGPMKSYPEYVAHLDSASHHEKKANLHVNDTKAADGGEQSKQGLRNVKADTGEVSRGPPALGRGGRQLLQGGGGKAETVSSRKQDPQVYDPQVAVGQEFMKPVRGFLCKLCNEFSYSEAESRVHCRSESHFQKFISRNQKPAVAKMEGAKVDPEQQPRAESGAEGHDPAAAEEVYADDNFIKTEGNEIDEGNEIEVILEDDEQAAGGGETHEEENETLHKGGNQYEGAEGGFEPLMHEDDYNNEVDYDEEGAAYGDDFDAGAEDA